MSNLPAMTPPPDYLDKNRASWNARTPVHVASEFYDMKSFMAGQCSLKDIEVDLLGDITGKSLLHLQCHFGQDSLSLARRGAHVTGVDLADQAIAQATELNAQLGTDATFICCNVYDLPSHLDEQFDIVFTSYGTIGWLPDLDRWAAVVARYLKPGGRFIMAEFHPVMWMLDEEFSAITYSYFNAGAIEEVVQGTYADTSAPIQTETVSWIHPLGDVLGSLLRSGLQLASFNEFAHSPYACFKHSEEFEPGKFRVRHLGSKIPLVYALEARKPAV